jgi:protein TonB
LVDFSPMNRNTIIAAVVLLTHLGGLWALQSGLLRRVAEIVVPAEILVEIMEPQSSVQKVPPAQSRPAQAAPKSIAKSTPKPTPVPLSVPTPVAVAEPISQPLSAAPTTTPAPVAPGTATASVGTPSANTNAGTTGANTAAQVAPKVELPSSDADYLHNPKPPYPPLSKRLGEQGKVVVRTLIGADGMPQKAEIKQSSGFDRLDQSALATALRWRYVPGKRAGVAEAMWFNVPFSFVLE